MGFLVRKRRVELLFYTLQWRGVLRFISTSALAEAALWKATRTVYTLLPLIKGRKHQELMSFNFFPCMETTAWSLIRKKTIKSISCFVASQFTRAAICEQIAKKGFWDKTRTSQISFRSSASEKCRVQRQVFDQIVLFDAGDKRSRDLSRSNENDAARIGFVAKFFFQYLGKLS